MKTVTLETKDGNMEVTFGVQDKDYEKIIRFLKHEETGIGLFLVKDITITLHSEDEETVIMEAK